MKTMKTILTCLLLVGMFQSLMAQTAGAPYLVPSDKCNGAGTTLEKAALGCNAIKGICPTATDGVYFIDIDGTGSTAPFKAYCDMTTDGGGWMLISKMTFTEWGPSKIEMTGDATLTGTIDPWSGGAISTQDTDLANFTTPTAPNYYPLGYRGNALLSPNDDLDIQAPHELYSIMSRNLIETMRTLPSLPGATNSNKRSSTVIRQVQGSTKYYIQTSKQFNPIQHKCATTTSTCTTANTSGCAANFITTVYSSYNPATNTASILATHPTMTWSGLCNTNQASGLSFNSNNPSGWFGGLSSFYDLSYTEIGPASNSTSGALSTNAINYNTNWFQYCGGVSTCPFTTYWLK